MKRVGNPIFGKCEIDLSNSSEFLVPSIRWGLAIDGEKFFHTFEDRDRLKKLLEKLYHRERMEERDNGHN